MKYLLFILICVCCFSCGKGEEFAGLPSQEHFEAWEAITFTNNHDNVWDCTNKTSALIRYWSCLDNNKYTVLVGKDQITSHAVVWFEGHGIYDPTWGNYFKTDITEAPERFWTYKYQHHFDGADIPKWGKEYTLPEDRKDDLIDKIGYPKCGFY